MGELAQHSCSGEPGRIDSILQAGGREFAHGAGDSRLFTLCLRSGGHREGPGLNSKNGTESSSLKRKFRVWITQGSNNSTGLTR